MDHSICHVVCCRSTDRGCMYGPPYMSCCMLLVSTLAVRRDHSICHVVCCRSIDRGCMYGPQYM